MKGGLFVLEPHDNERVHTMALTVDMGMRMEELLSQEC